MRSRPYRPSASSCVPTTAPTLTVATCTPVATALDIHPTVVADVHAVVAHAAPDSDPVALRSYDAKRSPVTVTDEAPVDAPLPPTCETTGASNEYVSTAALELPTTAPTVTCSVASPSTLASDTQCTAVADVHLEH